MAKCVLCVPVRFSDSGGVRRTPETGEGVAGPAKSFAAFLDLRWVDGVSPLHPGALVSLLEYAVTKNVPATPLECALAEFLDFKWLC